MNDAAGQLKHLEFQTSSSMILAWRKLQVFFCVLAVDTWRLRLLFANDTEGNERYRGMLSMDSDGYELLLIPSDGR